MSIWPANIIFEQNAKLRHNLSFSMKRPSCFSLADALHRESSYVLKLSKLDDLIDFIQQNKFEATVQQCKPLLLFGGKGISRIDLMFEE